MNHRKQFSSPFFMGKLFSFPLKKKNKKKMQNKNFQQAHNVSRRGGEASDIREEEMNTSSFRGSLDLPKTGHEFRVECGVLVR